MRIGAEVGKDGKIVEAGEEVGAGVGEDDSFGKEEVEPKCVEPKYTAPALAKTTVAMTKIAKILVMPDFEFEMCALLFLY